LVSGWHLLLLLLVLAGGLPVKQLAGCLGEEDLLGLLSLV
jgi:hypothetical protein